MSLWSWASTSWETVKPGPEAVLPWVLDGGATALVGVLWSSRGSDWGSSSKGLSGKRVRAMFQSMPEAMDGGM